MRLHYPLNTEDHADEFLVFQGASYFRGVSKRQLTLCRRGVWPLMEPGRKARNPLIFREFWVERPSSKHDFIVVHALLDSGA